MLNRANNEDLFINEITQSKDEYLKNVEIAKEHIAAGDIFPSGIGETI